MLKKVIIFISLILLLATSATAIQEGPYHLKLLAVQDEGNGNYEGSDADLFLELKEGSGRVFLDTYPLTKMDTQISTRFAKEISCKHFKLNCDKYDFIFTIKAKTNIIGGPSAGAAIAALTTIALLDLEYDNEVAITGTVNSGGLIGQVGGTKEKLEAASRAGLKKVLIAQGSKVQETLADENKYLDLEEYGRELGLEVVEVMDLDEAMFYLTGLTLNQEGVEITENVEYQKIMRGLGELLCGRTEKIEEEIRAEGVVINFTVAEELNQRKESAQNATLKGDYYSAASFCFRNNIFLKDHFYLQKSPNRATFLNLFNILEKKVNSLEKQLAEEKIETISDLQTLMIVKERLNEVKEQVAEYKEKRTTGLLKELGKLLAYAEERFFSALSWKQFFAMDGKKFILDKQHLRSTCQQKISEAEERLQYVNLFVGGLNTLNIREKIDSSTNALYNEELELCLITASQAKADANAILSTLGLGEEDLEDYLWSKMKAAERVISQNSAEGVFPILGYSYYRYAQSLQETEKYTVLVYLEYALEMSDLGIYFPEEQEYREVEEEFQLDPKWVFLSAGFLLGIIITGIVLLVFRMMRGKKKKVKKKNRKK